MKDTRSTRVSATVFHQHKYLTTPTVTPADRVLAAAKNFSEEIKGRMPQHLSTTNVDHLERLGNILKQRMPQVEDDAPCVSPPITPIRHLLRLTTTVVNGRIIASATPPHPTPVNPTIVLPRRPRKVFISSPQTAPHTLCPSTMLSPLVFPFLTSTAPHRAPPRVALAPRVAQYVAA